jgi:hypothetical protein
MLMKASGATKTKVIYMRPIVVNEFKAWLKAWKSQAGGAYHCSAQITDFRSSY